MKDFLGKPAPAGYIAGLGRGATGFTTGADLGSARDDPLLLGVDVDEDRELGGSGDNADESGLFAARAQIEDPEDLEADRIYAEIEARMANRRKKPAAGTEAGEVPSGGNAPAQLLFADLKRDLQRVSVAEWAALPESGDFRAKRLKRSGNVVNERERFMPVPDSVLASGLASQALTQEVKDANENDGNADVMKLGEERRKLLAMHLDQVQCNFGAVEGVAEEGPEEPGSAVAPAAENIADAKKARLLFKGIIRADRSNPLGWIGAARLEQQLGNGKQARMLIGKACEECGRHEDVWLEAVQLHDKAGLKTEASDLLAQIGRAHV